ncbi:hypothetical protein NSTC745_03337 [Nostoc sp. DSM 114161]|jgi:TPR repeat protein
MKAKLYETDVGVKVNYTEAAKWYLIAALLYTKDLLQKYFLHSCG